MFGKCFCESRENTGKATDAGSCECQECNVHYINLMCIGFYPQTLLHSKNDYQRS